MKTMLLSFSILVSSLATRTVAADMTNQAPVVVTGLAEVTIELSEKDIKTNQPFVANLAIKNISTNETLYFHRYLAAEQDSDIVFTVISPSGQDISPKPAIASHGSGYTVTLRSNQVHDLRIMLSKMCSFNEIGSYKIVAKKRLTTSGGSSFWAESKVLELSVVTGRWEMKTNVPSGF